MTSKNRYSETEKTHTRGMSPRVAPPKPEGLTKPPKGTSAEEKTTTEGKPIQGPAAENS